MQDSSYVDTGNRINKKDRLMDEVDMIIIVSTKEWENNMLSNNWYARPNGYFSFCNSSIFRSRYTYPYHASYIHVDVYMNDQGYLVKYIVWIVYFEY